MGRMIFMTSDEDARTAREASENAVEVAGVTAQAVAELGVVAAAAQQTAEDMAQAVAELGVLVASMVDV